MRRLLHCRRGATAIEYGLFLGLAAIVLMSGASSIGAGIGGTFSQAGAAMAAAPAGGPHAARDGGDAHARMVHIGETQEHFIDEHR